LATETSSHRNTGGPLLGIPQLERRWADLLTRQPPVGPARHRAWESAQAVATYDGRPTQPEP